ncbi:MAG: type II toxin-antitoxin system RelE/ParE family toxin [Planctomycetota bacterium]
MAINSIGIRPRARLDVVELATQIGTDSVFAATRFLDAIERTFAFLSESPQIGPIYPTKNSRLSGLRVFRVKGFPNHLTFYLERPGGIEIVRVLHGARDLDDALEDE